MKYFKDAIRCLKKELENWKTLKKDFEKSRYQNDSSIGTDRMHEFYTKEINNCNKMIETYKLAINKLKGK